MFWCFAGRRASASRPCSSSAPVFPRRPRSFGAPACSPSTSFRSPRCISSSGRACRLSTVCPEPQAAALRAAFGLTSDQVDDGFLSSLALLSLLAEAASHRPILCLIDDAQWLDRSSADALVFVARRLLAEPIGMLIAAREGEARRFEGASLPELRLSGISDRDARKLVRLREGESVADSEMESLIQSALGNPLALLELPLVPRSGDGRRDEHPRGSPGSVEDVFRARVEQLPEPTRRVLLLAAADDVGDVTCLRRAAESVGSGLEVLQQAEDEGLIKVDHAVAFRHPLIRSAVYRSATIDERRAAHACLAAVLDDDPEKTSVASCGRKRRRRRRGCGGARVCG